MLQIPVSFIGSGDFSLSAEIFVILPNNLKLVFTNLIRK